MQEKAISQTARELILRENQVAQVIELTEEGATIPFIARYRKERTGGLDELQISEVLEKFQTIVELEKRRLYILEYLEKKELLSPELKKKILQAKDITTLEDIYLPYKPRKKTLADQARDLGLEPLAILIKQKNLTMVKALQEAEKFVNKQVADAEIAINHAMNILAQEVSDHADARAYVRQLLLRGKLQSSVKRGKKEEGEKYQDYFDFSESLDKVASHRIMAMMRAYKEGYIKLTIEPNAEIRKIKSDLAKICFAKDGDLLSEAAEIAYEKYLLNSLTTEILHKHTERSQLDSVSFFRKNLEKILLAAPFGEKAVIGIDPGIRTGCKAAALAANGAFLDFTTMYLSKDPLEYKKIMPWLTKYNIQGIAIGNGTYGRETFALIQEMAATNNLNGLTVTLVDEDGASIYSASEAAREEFPEMDVTVRGAISIGRRFQDPMAELVKIDPKSLGVGQYQHDIPQTMLQQKLTETVEWAVNKIGVNLNTASYHLLSYVSGLDKRHAKQITAYREKNDKISSREELKKIKGIGEKIFEQSAGFLRIINGANPLDATGVHPESYTDLIKVASLLETKVDMLVAKPEILRKEKEKIKKNISIAELDSIVAELEAKGRDPRESFQAIKYDDAIKSWEDITPGMVLHGFVDNVAAFGAFIDLGIKEKGLVHISELSHEFVTDINSVLAVGDRVLVKVLAMDEARKRISLSIKQADATGTEIKSKSNSLATVKR